MITTGAEQIPAERYDARVAAGDRALSVIASFFQCALNDALAELWQSVAPNTRPVDFVFTHDPKEKFNESKLPALYLFQESSTTETEADGIFKDTRVLSIYWLPRMASSVFESLRKSTQNLIGKAISQACRSGRTRSWVHPDDTDPSATDSGSFVLPFAGVERISRLLAKPLELTISIQDELEKPIAFRGWASQIQIVEYFEETPDFPVPSALDATVTRGT